MKTTFVSHLHPFPGGLGIIQADPYSVDECYYLEALLHVNTSLKNIILDLFNLLFRLSANPSASKQQ